MRASGHQDIRSTPPARKRASGAWSSEPKTCGYLRNLWLGLVLMHRYPDPDAPILNTLAERVLYLFLHRFPAKLASNPLYNFDRMPKYSIVVPLHNEQESITALYDRLKAVMEGTGESFELVFVDDGSVDRTYKLLREMVTIDSRVVVVKLRRNFGQTSALAAGFANAQGEYIIAMDGDLQHDPEDIPKFLEKLEQGYDLVSGWRKERVDNLVMRRLPSRIANWLMSKLSGVNIHDFGTTFKAYRREIIQQLPLYGELHRFIPALASWYGASICEIPIKNIVRPKGNSHYGISRTIRVFFDLITIRFLLKYMYRPLHLFGTVGALCMFAGMGISSWLMISKFAWHQSIWGEHGPLLIFAAVLMVCGVQLLALGLLGDLQVRNFQEPARRVPYTVAQVLRSHSQEQAVNE